MERGGPVASSKLLRWLRPFAAVGLDIGDVTEQDDCRGQAREFGLGQCKSRLRLDLVRSVEPRFRREQNRVVFGAGAAVLPAVVEHALLDIAKVVRDRKSRRGGKGCRSGGAA